MEESEKRRVRLKAMRTEAVEGVHVETGISGFPPYGLSNPFIENERPPLQHPSRRFDFYTDPMSAFHGSTSYAPPQQASRGHYRTPPRPPYQSMNPTPSYRHPSFYHPGGGMIQFPGDPSRQAYPGGSFEAANSWNRQQPQFPPAGGIMRPSFGQGIAHGNNNDFGSRSNRGRGRGRGRGGSHDHISAKERPDLFYRKSMTEDPWKDLSPIIWKGHTTTPESEKSWLPDSIAAKKASEETPKISTQGGSLALYLAEAFHDSSARKITSSGCIDV